MVGWVGSCRRWRSKTRVTAGGWVCAENENHGLLIREIGLNVDIEIEFLPENGLRER